MVLQGSFWHTGGWSYLCCGGRNMASHSKVSGEVCVRSKKMSMLGTSLWISSLNQQGESWHSGFKTLLNRVIEAEIKGTEEHSRNFCLCWVTVWNSVCVDCGLESIEDDIKRYETPGERCLLRVGRVWEKCPTQDDDILTKSWKISEEFSRWARTRRKGPSRGDSFYNVQEVKRNMLKSDNVKKLVMSIGGVYLGGLQFEPSDGEWRWLTGGSPTGRRDLGQIWGRWFVCWLGGLGVVDHLIWTLPHPSAFSQAVLRPCVLQESSEVSFLQVRCPHRVRYTFGSYSISRIPGRSLSVLFSHYLLTTYR